ncbi:UNVERIFIED_CONTAM: hypothetical protein FKN15_044051 [Acipenser sinensis]
MATICSSNAWVLTMLSEQRQIPFCAVCSRFQKRSRAKRADHAEGRSSFRSLQPLLTLSRSPSHEASASRSAWSVSRSPEHKTKKAKTRRHSPNADVSALQAQMMQLASTVVNQQSLLERLVNLIAPSAPTPTFGVLETPSAPVLVPPLPQLIEKEQDNMVSLAASMEEGEFEGGTEDPCLEGSPSETYMAPSGPLADELAALVSRATARVQSPWTEETQGAGKKQHILKQ